MKGMCIVCVLISLFALALHIHEVMTLWTYRVEWPEGKVTSYTYPRTTYGDCLYDNERDHLICMRNHDYWNVMNTWRYDPELIVYVSVRCLVPHAHLHHSSPLAPTCLCKEGQRDISSAVSRGSSSHSSEKLDYCQLEELSSSMFNDLDQLEVLDLSFNLLQQLSAVSLAPLQALKVLSLVSNPLRHLPEGLVCPLKSLEVLNLRGMHLTSFPGQVFRCDGNNSVASSVRWLDVSANHINEMASASLWYLSNVVFLNVSDNLLHALPAHPLLGAPNLTTLSLSHNLLQQAPEAFCEGATDLKRLLLHDNMFASLSLASFDTCKNLMYLDLSDNSLSSLPGPPASLPSLQYLHLSHNRLTTLNSPLIGPNCSIHSLDLSHNDLRTLTKSALETMSTLVHLDLHDNALNESAVDLGDVFVNLTKLQTLHVSQNQLTSISQDDFEGLTSLRKLDLSKNRIRQVSFASSTSLTQLTHLNLSANQLTSLSSDVILPLISLRVLDVSENLLHRVAVLHVPASLTSLNLRSNALTKLPKIPYGTGLHQLDLSSNAISEIPEDDLLDFPELGQLNLARNSLRTIHASAFSRLHQLRRLQLSHNRLAFEESVSVRLFAGLRRLKDLDLSHNHFSDIKALFQSDSLSALVDLDVSYNAISRISEQLNQLNRTMHLEHLNLEGCHLREMSAVAFSNLIYLRSVNLQYNTLTHLPLFHTHPGIKYHLHGNPVTCDCYMSWLKHDVVHVLGQAISTHDYDVTTCRTLPRGHLRPVRDVSRRDFLCVISSDDCPRNCMCYSQQEAGDPEVVFCAGGVSVIPLNIPATTRVLSLEGGWLEDVGGLGDEESRPLQVEELYLNNSGITHIPPFAFDRLPYLSVLYLDHNHLEELPAEVFAQSLNLTSLFLASNRLSELPPDLLANTQKLKTLDLSHNALSVLTEGTVQELGQLRWLENLQLSHNPLTCDCQNIHLYNWLKENRSRVTDRDDIYCKNDPTRRFIDAGDEQFDCSGEDLPSWVIGVVFIGLPLLILVLVLAYRFRQVIAAVLYSRFGVQCMKPHSAYVPLGRLYDASVLFDHSDRKCRWWVEHIFLPRLTTSAWRLRVYVPRAGHSMTSNGTVVDNAVYSVRQSAVCIVLVSKHFGHHQHTVTCLAQVLQQAQIRPSSLVLITWGELTKQTLECGIRQFMGTRQHLPITTPFFWDRLLYLLPAPHPATSQLRRHSLIAACRFRSLSDVSTTSADIPETTQTTDVSQHL